MDLLFESSWVLLICSQLGLRVFLIPGTCSIDFTWEPLNVLLVSYYVSVYLYVCVHVYACVYMYVCDGVYMWCVGKKGENIRCPALSDSTLFPLRQGLSLHLELGW